MYIYIYIYHTYIYIYIYIHERAAPKNREIRERAVCFRSVKKCWDLEAFSPCLRLGSSCIIRFCRCYLCYEKDHTQRERERERDRSYVVCRASYAICMFAVRTAPAIPPHCSLISTEFHFVRIRIVVLAGSALWLAYLIVSCKLNVRLKFDGLVTFGS